MTPVVLLHPIGLDRDTWQFLEVAEGMAIDLPGHGEAPTLDETDDKMDMAALAAYVCALVPGRFHVVGLSLGGMIAQHLAVGYPDRIASLVIACTTAVGSSALADRAVAVEQTGMGEVADSYLARWFTEAAFAADNQPGVEYARKRLLADRPSVIAAYWRAMSRHDTRDVLRQIRVPTTVLAGSADQSAPVAAVREVADAIPGARFAVVEGPHMLQLETPTALRAALDEHFESIQSSA